MFAHYPVARRLASAFVLTAFLAAIPFGSISAADPVEVNVILPLTGSVALVGKSAQSALAALQEAVNKTGGIHGRPLKFVLSDDQSNPNVAVQLATRIVALKPAVLLGPNLNATCSAIAPLMKDGPVDMCFSPGIHPDEGSFVFSPAPSTLDLAIVTARYAKKRGWKKMAFIFSTDGSGIDGEKVITQTFAAPENKDVGIAVIEHFGVTDLSVAAQLARIKTFSPDALYVWASGTPSSTVMRGIQDAGIDVPVLTSYSNATSGQMLSYKGYLPKELLMAGLPTMVAPDQLPRGALRDRVASYNRDLTAAGVRPDALQTTPWDAGLLIVDALRRIGPNATAAQVRDYLSGQRNFTGVTGTFDFKKVPQRGVDWKSSVLMTRWDPAKDTFVAAGPLGG
jgi:branched-chain amino acid transport system substrate-binding protein